MNYMKEVLATYEVMAALSEGRSVKPCRPADGPACAKLNGGICREMIRMSQVSNGVVLVCSMQQEPIRVEPLME